MELREVLKVMKRNKPFTVQERGEKPRTAFIRSLGFNPLGGNWFVELIEMGGRQTLRNISDLGKVEITGGKT